MAAENLAAERARSAEAQAALQAQLSAMTITLSQAESGLLGAQVQLPVDLV